jgi:NADH:ubiquinone oxidoreductase subunit 5 (subunit L)/multisubunit Na+/H+ antiporter MnhA subunit
MAILLSLSVAAAGTLLAFLVYSLKRIDADAVAARFTSLHRFLMNKWYFDELYGRVVVGGTLVWTALLNWFDAFIVDGVVNGSAAWTRALVFGYTDHAREQKTGARVYMGVAVIVTLFVVGAAVDWFWPVQPTASSVLLALGGILLTGGLSLFLFFVGAGGFDRHVVDGVVNATAYLSGFGGLLLRKFQTGKVQTYVIFAVMGAMALYFLFRII